MDCRLCKTFLPDLGFALKHFRRRHNFNQLHKIDCTANNCKAVLGSFRAFRRHIENCGWVKLDLSRYKNDVCDSVKELLFDGNNFDLPNSERNFSSIQNCTDLEIECEQGKNIDRNCLLNSDHQSQAHQHVRSYLSKCIPDSTINEIIKNTTELYQPAIHSVLQLLNRSDGQITNELRINLKRKLEPLLNPFKEINTTHKRRKILTASIPKPLSIKLDSRLERRWSHLHSGYIYKEVDNTFEYVSILNTLREVMSNVEVCNHVLNERSNLRSNEDDFYRSCEDGIRFKNNELVKLEDIILKIQLYYDEFQLGNPLGTKCVATKLGAIYFSLKNLPLCFQSKLDNIFLVALFHSQDRKSLGFNKILQPLVNDLKILETKGIVCRGFEKNNVLKGTITSVCSDNLGFNEIFGLSESFSANHFCRFCLLDKDETRSNCREVPSVLRTAENYKKHLIEALKKKDKAYFGIKNDCILNELKYFQFPTFGACDIMHDILEGIAQFEIKLFVQELIQTGVVSLEGINARIANFNFGKLEVKNRPSFINLDKKNLNQRAAQMYTLLRFFPLLVGDLVNKKVLNGWRIILLLIEITDLVFSPKINNCQVMYLTELIEEHHSLLIQHYCVNLKPKHHMMTHYPSIIKSEGPLVYLWSMRYEGKHNLFKQISQSLKNFINITKTLAFRHQSSIFWFFKSKNFKIFLTNGKAKPVKINEKTWGANFFKYFRISEKSKILSVNYINYNFRFEKNSIIFTGLNKDRLPNFTRIQKIFIYKENAALCKGKKLNTLYWDEEFHGFVVEPAKGFHFFNIKNFSSHAPLTIHQNLNPTDLRLFIVPRYYLL